METKLKFKVGDKVRVKSLEWYNNSKNISGEIIAKEGRNFGIFHPYMHSWCGDVLKIEKVKNGYYYAVTNGWKWYDWMLEDEVVTEEKQEDKQLNQNDMETKEMTKGEVFAYLASTKILCTSTEETAKVQEKLFELGIIWMSYGTKVRKNRYLLFIGKQGEIAYCSNIETWMQDINRRIEPAEILAIKLKEEEGPKFDPNTLQPFEKVLVREIGGIWIARFFDIYTNGFCVTSGHCWSYCIPYNEDTKHLHGTTEDAPEFYRI